MKQIADREQIELMIPYGPSIIFLDEVCQTRKGGFVGTFKVTEQSCGGGSHKIGGNHLLFRGVDLGEMAAQFLGIVWGTQNPKFSEGKMIVLVGIGKLNLQKPIYVEDILRITITEDDFKQRVIGDPDKLSALIVGKTIIVFRKKEEVATIGSITLMCGDQETIGLAK